MNCVAAACRSCSSQVISTILHPASDQMRKNSVQMTAPLGLDMRTFSYTKGKFCQPSFPDWGPNIGCVQRMSADEGISSSSKLLGYSLTERTSTTSLPASASFGNFSRTFAVDKTEVQNMTTCGSFSSATLMSRV
ncbi:unnamed protein product [Prorocentrum cordatum]|uniref:Uncharacterized protein n=1 Tax=Prorocentrum cordatum TaxID=2364126 RepID=A0ABN9THE1_9DINO|nr:unnamed protein product [Polarella glacialis]